MSRWWLPLLIVFSCYSLLTGSASSWQTYTFNCYPVLLWVLLNLCYRFNLHKSEVLIMGEEGQQFDNRTLFNMALIVNLDRDISVCLRLNMCLNSRVNCEICQSQENHSYPMTMGSASSRNRSLFYSMLWGKRIYTTYLLQYMVQIISCSCEKAVTMWHAEETVFKVDGSLKPYYMPVLLLLLMSLS